MKSYFVRQRAAVIAGTGVLAFLAACEDKRMSQLDTGITRDSAVTVLAQKIKGSGSDSEPNVYTRSAISSGERPTKSCTSPRITRRLARTRYLGRC